MCEVRIKSIQPFTSYKYYYDFIMSRTASLNVYYRSFQSRGATRPSIIYGQIYTVAKATFVRSYGGRFRAFLTYFPSISHLFLHYFPKISHFPTISRLFHSYFSFLTYFSNTSQLFLISRRCFSFLSYTSQLFLSYFSTISQ